MKRLSLFAVALALFATGCSSSSSAPTTTSPTQPTFTAACACQLPLRAAHKTGQVFILVRPGPVSKCLREIQAGLRQD